MTIVDARAATLTKCASSIAEQQPSRDEEKILTKPFFERVYL